MLEKPAIIFWTIALSFKLFGVNEFASRVPSALSAAFIIIGLFLAARVFVSYRAALLSSLVLLSSALFLVVGRLALTDMLFSLFVSTSILSFLIALERDRVQFLWLGYVSAAFSFMTKGPLALIVIGASIFCYLVLMHRTVHRIWCQAKRLQIFPGLLILACLGAPWYIALHIATDGAFSEEFFLAQNLARLVGNQRISLHAEPSWFYAPVYVGGLFPWSFVLIGFLAMTRKRFISSLESARKLEMMALCWLVCTFAAISCASGKLPTYVVPSLPAVALLMGVNLDRLARINNPRLPAWLTLLSGIVSIVGIPEFCSHIGLTMRDPGAHLVISA